LQILGLPRRASNPVAADRCRPCCVFFVLMNAMHVMHHDRRTSRSRSSALQHSLTPQSSSDSPSLRPHAAGARVTLPKACRFQILSFFQHAHAPANAHPLSTRVQREQKSGEHSYFSFIREPLTPGSTGFEKLCKNGQVRHTFLFCFLRASFVRAAFGISDLGISVGALAAASYGLRVEG
jgi:hypothetical protein